MANGLLERARQAAAEYEKLNLSRTAVFWAEKAVCLSNGAFEDIYCLANALYRDAQYRRTIHVLERDSHLELHLSCRYLGALCDVAQKDYESAIEKLEAEATATESYSLNVRAPTSKCNTLLSPEDEKFYAGRQAQAQAAACCLRGIAYQEMLNMNVARNCYVEALRLDPLCYEAWDRLTGNSVIGEASERDVCNLALGLLRGEFSDDDFKSLKFLYDMRLVCKCQLSDQLSPPAALKNSSDVVACQALQCYTKYDVHAALDCSNRVMERDPLHPFCMLVHLACLVALEKKNELFILAHEAVQDFPEQASSWYAIGCYYLTVSEFEKARLHFSKATSLDPNFGQAWLAFGHAFSADGIHDQANTCYFSAMKVMPGCHYPLVTVALYHSMNHDPVLARKYLKEARELAPKDGIVCHERGTLAYQQGDYRKALEFFMEALDVCDKSVQDKVSSSSWEPLLNNIGHCYRRLKDYDSALAFHHRALALDCSKASTHTSIGFIYALRGSFDKAIEHFHKALGLNRQDIIAVDMLEKMANCLAEDESFLEGLLCEKAGDDQETAAAAAGVNCSLDLDAVRGDMDMLASVSKPIDSDVKYLPEHGLQQAFATPNVRGGNVAYGGTPMIMAPFGAAAASTPAYLYHRATPSSRGGLSFDGSLPSPSTAGTHDDGMDLD